MSVVTNLFRHFRRLRPTARPVAVQSRQWSSAAEPKPFSAIPGPKPLPVLGNLLELRKNYKRQHLYFRDLLKEYGEIVKLTVPGGSDMVLVADPVLYEGVLRGEGKYPLRPGNESIRWLFENELRFPTDFAFSDGEEWKRVRSAVGKQIIPRNVYSYFNPLNDICRRFTDSLRSFRSDDGVLNDISDPLRLLLVELSGHFVFGADLRAVDGRDEDAKTLANAVQNVLKSLSHLFYEPPIHKIFPTRASRLFISSKRTVHNIGKKHVDKVKERIASGVEEGEASGMLEQWLRDGKLTEEEAVATAATMFSAGVDTTANQACFMLYEMAKRPEIQDKLYAEIKSVLGTREPTAEDLSKMPYMKGCVLESFRCLSTVQGAARQVIQDISLCGYHIPAETTVMYCFDVAGQNEKLFPNPENFDPERWQRDEKNAFAILPFGFGPRSCYGKRFAELELKLILIQMTRNFLMSTNLEEISIENAVVLKPVGKVPLKLLDR